MPAPSGIQVRWARLTDGAARREVAWELLRSLLPDPGIRITNACPRCGGPHGPVRIDHPGVVASVAYAGGFALVGMVSDAGALSVGIDTEPEHDAVRDAAGLTGIVRAGVRSSVREWTRIEAVLKADGRGLRADPGLVSIAESAPSTWSAEVGDSVRRFQGRDVAGPRGIVVSVAVECVSAAEAPAVRVDPATA